MSCLIPFDDALISGPTMEPLDLAEVKKALRFTSTSEDTLLDTWISAARQMFEENTGRQLMTATRARTWRGTVDRCYELELPYPPLQEVESITYEDSAGDTAVLGDDSYEVVTGNDGATGRRGRVRLASNASWPTTRALTVQYVCGYGDAPGAVPELVRAALHLLVSHFHQFRSPVQQGVTLATVPLGLEMILNSFRYTALPKLPDVRGQVTT